MSNYLNENYIEGDFDTISTELYPRGWKALQFGCSQRPKGLQQWFNFLWGWDIWYGGFPLLKILVAINIAVWIVLLIAK